MLSQQTNHYEIRLLRSIVRNCQQACKREPHNEWDGGTEIINVHGHVSHIRYTCQVCGRIKTYPL